MSNDILPLLAYGPERQALETVMRFHAVKRWHMIDTTRQQTVAEHSANVAMLSSLIARSAPINWFQTATVVAFLALCHDIGETFAGDMPGHVKIMFPQLHEEIAQVESKVTHSCFRHPSDPNTDALIKLCDLADGIRFIRLHGVDVTARHAREGVEHSLEQKFNFCQNELEWPEHMMKHVKDHIIFYAYEAS